MGSEAPTPLCASREGEPTVCVPASIHRTCPYQMIMTQSKISVFFGRVGETTASKDLEVTGGRRGTDNSGAGPVHLAETARGRD